MKTEKAVPFRGGLFHGTRKTADTDLVSGLQVPYIQTVLATELWR